MKANLKKMIGGVTLGLALLAHTSPTWAGLKAKVEVVIANNVARGSMTSARYSGDNLQQIGCFAYSGTYAAGAGATCYAYDKAGGSHGCTTYNPNLVGRVSAITDSSIITFSTQPGSGQCFTIMIDNGSFNLK